MTSAQVVETSVTTTDNNPSQDYTNPDDQTTLLHVTPRFKPFIIIFALSLKIIEWFHYGEVIWQSKNVVIVRNRPCFDFLYFRHRSPIKFLDNIFLFSYPEQ